ncbi:hypothetical protein KC717_03765 [Candidatus Dojkabacteria bacterium]|uniref:Uncharacterized protein n=1 Tax=Candidatus Dojkabacteria bacterium TaxID=2099670 RepID=A0A955L8W0_9BACT|nr:hypothetical protein [Candidatus Dojkabacteria bacterium]
MKGDPSQFNVYEIAAKFLKIILSFTSLYLLASIAWQFLISEDADGILPIAENIAGTKLEQDVLVLIYDPRISSQGNAKLTVSKQWNDPYELVDDYVEWVGVASRELLTYNVTDIVEVNDAFIPKADGFRYSDIAYINCINDLPSHTSCYSPDAADYPWILNRHAICEEVNSGKIDEVWIFGGPWFGLHSSVLYGPEGFPLASDHIISDECEKTIPVMGFNYELGLDYMITNFGHRVQETMREVYNGGEQNSLATNWDKFWMNSFESASFDYSGCGTVDFPPNASQRGDYSNQTRKQSYCNNFADYPNVSTSKTSLDPVDCSLWGCSKNGYLTWWFNRIPYFEGTGLDEIFNNWWYYIGDPNIVLTNTLPVVGIEETTNKETLPSSTGSSLELLQTDTGETIPEVSHITDTGATLEHLPIRSDQELVLSEENFITCYKENATICDLDEDGVVNIIDFKLFTKSMSQAAL